MNTPHIFIVEDEKDISDVIDQNLKGQGYKTTIIHNGDEAIRAIQESNKNIPDLFILDRMLPGTSGSDICKFIRLYAATKSHPILMLTALARPEQIVEGLDAGADDYVTKPFDMNILLARVRVLLRRGESIKSKANSAETNILTMKEIKIDTEQCKTWIEGQELDLTLSEYKLLCTFLQSPGKVFTRNQLVEKIQDGPVHVTDRTIDTHIFGLRKKLGNHSNLIETIRGVGYRIITNG